jgi:hypothetical protein
MNLHGIASGFVGAVNPLTPITIQRSTGYAVGNATSNKHRPTLHL